MPPPTDRIPAVSVTVLRSGGLAGLTRRWHVEPPASDAGVWVELIESCPWPAASAPRRAARGADRFAWTVSARCGDRDERAELAETDLDGPWRALVDAVRDAAR